MAATPPTSTSPLSAPLTDPLVPTRGPPIILADMIDDLTGEFESVVAGRDPTDAAVQVTFTTERGSGAAAQRHGHRFRSLRHADDLNAPESEAAVEGLAVEAASHLLAARDIRLVRVRGGVAAGRGDTGEARIEFTNLRTGKIVPRKIPVSA